MQGLVKVKVSLITRRLIVLIPALVILGAGLDPTWAAALAAVLLIALNVALLVLIFTAS